LPAFVLNSKLGDGQGVFFGSAGLLVLGASGNGSGKLDLGGASGPDSVAGRAPSVSGGGIGASLLGFDGGGVKSAPRLPFDPGMGTSLEVPDGESSNIPTGFWLFKITKSMLKTIQTDATTIVIFVKTSPAFVPNALEPPTPPNAPANPPPLPRWIKTRQMRKSDVITKETFKSPMKKPTAEVLHK
jgi:hypothetical protein